MKLASSEARNSTTLAISSAVPARLRGVEAKTGSRRPGVSKRNSDSGVRMRPGGTQSTRGPCSHLRVKVTTRYAASRQTCRWWGPPARAKVTTLAVGEGRVSIERPSGESPRRAWTRSARGAAAPPVASQAERRRVTCSSGSLGLWLLMWLLPGLAGTRFAPLCHRGCSLRPPGASSRPLEQLPKPCVGGLLASCACPPPGGARKAHREQALRARRGRSHRRVWLPCDFFVIQERDRRGPGASPDRGTRHSPRIHLINPDRARGPSIS
jgi:hypothetical protein